MKGWSIFLLIVGCTWALFYLWIFLVLAGISEPVFTIATVSYCAGMMVGPVVLVAGSLLLLRGVTPIYGSLLLTAGCVIFSGFVVYNSIFGMQRGPLEVQPLYAFYVILLLIMVLSDFAVYRIWRLISSLPTTASR